MSKKTMKFYDYAIIVLMVFLIVLQIIRVFVAPFSFDYLTISLLAGMIILGSVASLTK